MRIRFDEIYEFIKIHDKNRFSVLFVHRYCDKIYKIKYLLSEKSGITDSISHNFARIRTDSYDSPTEKILTFHNVISLINSVVNKKKH